LTKIFWGNSRSGWTHWVRVSVRY